MTRDGKSKGAGLGRKNESAALEPNQEREQERER